MLGVVYFVSGAAGLVYEVLWTKYLALLFGGAALAQAIVLATFLGGLAIGSAWLGRRADRSPNPLALYGRLELALCLLGLLVPLALPWVSSAFVAAAPGLGAPAALLLRAALAACLLLPPTIAMGGTLPALGRHLVRSGRGVGSSAAWLYAINSAGAVAGCLAAGYVLIPLFGLDFSTSLAAAGNLACGLAALALSRKRGRSVAPPLPEERDAQPLDPQSRRVILGAAAASGFAALVYEVGWMRLFSLVMGSSVYSFSAVVAGFIAGVALGAALCRKALVARVRPAYAFGLAELGAAFGVAATLPFYDRLPYALLLLGGVFNRIPLTFYLFEASKLVLCFAIMLVPAVALGMTLPLAAAALGTRGHAGRDLGGLWALNTAGNVAGALLAGLVLLPALGLRGLFATGAAAHLGAGLLAVLTSNAPARRRNWTAGVATACFAALALFSPPWDKLMLSRGDFRTPLASRYPDFARYRRQVHQDSLVFYQDDPEATVSVQRGAWGNLSLKVNGKVDASSTADMTTQLLIAHIPFLARPGAKDALVVGLGSGATAGAVLAHGPERVDVVEIAPAVADAARLFSPYTGAALDDPRLHLTIEDAKAFLKTTPRRYDLIVSEPSNTWIAGVAGLFTAEFYRDVKAKLSDDGVFAAWFHLYEMNDESVAMVLRTFASEFADVSLWETTPGQDLVLVGRARSGAAPSARALEAEFAKPGVKADLRRVGFHRLSTVLGLQAADDAVARAAGGQGPLNEDRFPFLEYDAPKGFWLQRYSKLIEYVDLRVDPAQRARLLLARYLKERRRRMTADERRDWKAYHAKANPRIGELAKVW